MADLTVDTHISTLTVDAEPALTYATRVRAARSEAKIALATTKRSAVGTAGYRVKHTYNSTTKRWE